MLLLPASSPKYAQHFEGKPYSFDVVTQRVAAHFVVSAEEMRTHVPKIMMIPSSYKYEVISLDSRSS